jgi:hypothetical protein
MTDFPLSAFGGWSDAAWFSADLMSDPDVVAFELPKLGGLRKQSFHIIDRSLTKAPSGKAKQDLEPAPKRTAGKLARLLDGYGALRAVASCRARLLFESGPVVFFADIPTAKLKQRAANKLRREVIGLGLKACSVRTDTAFATLMFWLAAEQAITDFIEQAAPDHALHPDFERPPPVPGTPPAKAPSPANRDREAKLLRQIADLQLQVSTLTRAQSAVGAMEQLGLDDAKLKSMLKLLHPDRHGNSEAANEAAKWVNSMRDLLKGKV